MLESMTLVLRLLMATACGAVLGWERTSQHKPAGLRTHMLVALGAAAFTLATLHLPSIGDTTGRRFEVDPSRTIQGVVGGIGFLGAGSIIQSRGSVRGITTAATIWVMGALGVACAAGSYVVAITTTIIAFLILRVLGWVENRWLHEETREEIA
jgi:putative Mg2+ transporter-C (MgtC) family protein